MQPAQRAQQSVKRKCWRIGEVQGLDWADGHGDRFRKSAAQELAVCYYLIWGKSRTRGVNAEWHGWSARCAVVHDATLSAGWAFDRFLNRSTCDAWGQHVD